MTSIAASSPWRSEFGDEWDVPAIPDLVDESWHNDACPSFGSADKLVDPPTRDVHDLRLWVEHPDPEQREVAEAGRFTVTYQPWSAEPVEGVASAALGAVVHSGDDLDAALAAFADAHAKIVEALGARQSA